MQADSVTQRAILMIDAIPLLRRQGLSLLLYPRGYKRDINGSRDGFVRARVTRASRLN